MGHEKINRGRIIKMGYEVVNITKIFDYYKNKYGLKTTLQIKFFEAKVDIDTESCFNFENNAIKWTIYTMENKIDALNLTMVIAGTNLRLDLEKGNLFTLLHEIKHAIDYTKNKKRFMKEIHKGFLTPKNEDTWINSPLERKAHKFAAKELDKWVTK